ncbi:NAD-dependent epimerase/dehydratase family protein [Niabella insulamsoli]|uniref:NAD-dependent epimerase/dehydratase family protein n=1 Tax=Niabella insulamsoli TaxID=3144874 RepID=UPI0031FE400B
MQTILGANGQIAEELTKTLYQQYTKKIRLVSRNPKKVHDSDELVSANLLNANATEAAVAGSEIVYLTVGLPMNSSMWEAQFPVMMQNVINACKKKDAKLVFFDNTYMYAKTSDPQTEKSPFAPEGRKSAVRAEIAEMLLKEIGSGSINAVICRAPEFYGPGKTQSITNTMIFDNIHQNKKLKVPLSDTTRRSLIWTPDASSAMALIAHTPDANNQTWHLPCDDRRPTYEQLINMAAEIYGKPLRHQVVNMLTFQIGGLFNSKLKELKELLPRYKQDNIFVSEKFKARFPDFKVTTFKEGISQIKKENQL